MDIRTLSYFVTVAEELNITRAATKLCISQPPLSAQIHSLEKELNTTLFIRGKRSLQLTESGKLLYRHAKEILLLVNKAKNEVKAMSDGMTGTISLGLVEGSAPNIAAKWIETFSTPVTNQGRSLSNYIANGGQQVGLGFGRTQSNCNVKVTFTSVMEYYGERL